MTMICSVLISDDYKDYEDDFYTKWLGEWFHAADAVVPTLKFSVRTF